MAWNGAAGEEGTQDGLRRSNSAIWTPEVSMTFGHTWTLLGRSMCMLAMTVCPAGSYACRAHCLYVRFANYITVRSIGHDTTDVVPRW